MFRINLKAVLTVVLSALLLQACDQFAQSGGRKTPPQQPIIIIEDAVKSTYMKKDNVGAVMSMMLIDDAKKAQLRQEGAMAVLQEPISGMDPRCAIDNWPTQDCKASGDQSDKEKKSSKKLKAADSLKQRQAAVKPPPKPDVIKYNKDAEKEFSMDVVYLRKSSNLKGIEDIEEESADDLSTSGAILTTKEVRAQSLDASLPGSFTFEDRGKDYLEVAPVTYSIGGSTMSELNGMRAKGDSNSVKVKSLDAAMTFKTAGKAGTGAGAFDFPPQFLYPEKTEEGSATNLNTFKIAADKDIAVEWVNNSDGNSVVEIRGQVLKEEKRSGGTELVPTSKILIVVAPDAGKYVIPKEKVKEWGVSAGDKVLFQIVRYTTHEFDLAVDGEGVEGGQASGVAICGFGTEGVVSVI